MSCITPSDGSQYTTNAGQNIDLKDLEYSALLRLIESELENRSKDED